MTDSQYDYSQWWWPGPFIPDVPLVPVPVTPYMPPAWTGTLNFSSTQRIAPEDVNAIARHVRDEFAWLIENDQGDRFWAGGHAWATDPNSAVRFARREDAEKVVAATCGAGVRVVEHLWVRLNTAAFVRGAQACREMLARFVEQGGDPVTAASIRANWNPSWGADPGMP